jgi:transcriptional regulator with XRE-family HTH domain
MEVLVDIGSRIKTARKIAGISQEELARRAGMSLKGMGDIERGDIADPHYSSLSKIAEALGMSVGELLEEPALSGKGKAPDEGPEDQAEEERRARNFLQQYPDEEERAKLLEKIVSIHAHYNKLFRDLIEAAKKQRIDVNGTSTMMSFFCDKGLQDALEQNGVIAYINSVLQGKVEATPEERESCKSFGMRIDVEITEAQRLVEEARELAREQHSAAHEAELGIQDEVELGIQDLWAYLKKVSLKN